ncbi:DUF1501 domain-containing protein [Pelagibius litoralis]|uniref:DUF1501 domain-containing protein n=1 Tax=Pelagibius litoralis TaxID=374515 RepID=A0A967EZD0_9PROT|nr:DUF1501 domain-containing protein [Pelagibius litoralis]NIA70174.1 DUF1501 domain-containing protein [Pelagibius litoralis]
MTDLNRRRLLAATAALPLGLGLMPRKVLGSVPQKTLVLVELSGGNDGLNTVVPYGDAAYYRARPKLAIKRDAVLPLDERLGLHPALEPLMEPWRGRELAVVLGLGYPAPNRSHFRSIEIWNTASQSNEVRQHGWLHQAVSEAGGLLPPQGRLGIVLGGAPGPLAGDALTAVIMKDSKQLARAAAMAGNGTLQTANPALDHILSVRRQTQEAARQIEARLASAPALGASFPKTPLGRQLKQAAALIAGGVPASVIKVQHAGYDTHAGQAGRHPRLLGELASSLAAFRRALRETGAWDRCLVMTYAEFGRRVGENASAGTDHGTAAPHFLLGGRLRGGLHGHQPSLIDLDGGDLRHSLDFRQVYAAIAAGWLGLPAGLESLGRPDPLDLFA